MRDNLTSVAKANVTKSVDFHSFPKIFWHIKTDRKWNRIHQNYNVTKYILMEEAREERLSDIAWDKHQTYAYIGGLVNFLISCAKRAQTVVLALSYKSTSRVILSRKCG